MHLSTRTLFGLLATAAATPVMAAPTTPAKPAATTTVAAPAKPTVKPTAAAPAKPAAKPAATPAKPAATPVATPALPTGVIAQVNGRNITRSEMMTTLEQLAGQPLLGQMIANTVVEQEAKRLGVSVTEAEIKAAVADAKQNIAMRSGLSFTEASKRLGLSDGFVRFEIRRQLLMSKAFAKSMEQEIPGLANQIKVSHLLIATQPIPGPDPDKKPLSDEEAKKKIDSILADIRSGKTTFDAAAKASSDDPGSGSAGGKMDIWFTQNGQMDPAFSAAAFKLAKEGDISEPVKSQFGWHIIRLDRKGASATAQEKSAYKNEMVERMSQDPRGPQAWVQGLLAKAKITTNPNALTTSK